MKLVFREKAWADYLYWQGADPKLLKRINELVRESMRTPFLGVGKPEPLRGEFSDWWSRRINKEHRLVYHVGEEKLVIALCRYHHDRRP